MRTKSGMRDAGGGGCVVGRGGDGKTGAELGAELGAAVGGELETAGGAGVSPATIVSA